MDSHSPSTPQQAAERLARQVDQLDSDSLDVMQRVKLGEVHGLLTAIATGRVVSQPILRDSLLELISSLDLSKSYEVSGGQEGSSAQYEGELYARTLGVVLQQAAAHGLTAQADGITLRQTRGAASRR